MANGGMLIGAEPTTRVVSSRTRNALLAAGFVILLVGLIIGALIGHFATKGGAHDALTTQGDATVSQKIIDEIKPDNIRKYLKDLTEHPHLAGTPADLEQAEELKAFWADAGLSPVNIIPYDVLLSIPDKDDPNRVVLYNDAEEAVFTSQLVEKIVRPEQNQSDVVPPFSAYSAPGTPKGDLIYVNYGRMQDFTWLKEQKGVDFTGKICIARYGKIFRGNKVKAAELFGAAGLVMYSDPADYAVDGQTSVYPNSWWLPKTGVQRGTTSIEGDPTSPGYPATGKVRAAEHFGAIGIIMYTDPADYAVSGHTEAYPDSWWLPSTGVQRGAVAKCDQTPGYPETESAFRLHENETDLPRIPVHPISYGDAQKFLEQLTGEEAPVEWRGELPITYRLGPGLANNGKVQMFISTHNVMRTTYNVFGYIEGAVEPDRYVLLGNHRDAWVFGAVDPSSGTAAMMEVARSMGKAYKDGWRPRRTIVFCSWGAEEYGILGSREFVEHFGHILGDRAVAYLNVDIAVQGNFTLRGRAMPMLFDVMRDTAKFIDNPLESEKEKGRKTMYDTWAANYAETGADGQPTGRPRIKILGSGSDFAPFVGKVGVTCADLRYHYDESLGISSYPLYHSVYETFHLVDTFMDPGFKLHTALSQYWAELGRTLADSYVIPFNLIDYGAAIEDYVNKVEAKYGDEMKANGLEKNLGFLRRASEQFKDACKQFHESLPNVDLNNPIAVRGVNDQMMQVERAFIDPIGLPGRPLIRNVVFAPSAHDSYAGASFPGITDVMFEIDKKTGAELTEQWRQVHKQLAAVTFAVESAAASLQPATQYMRHSEYKTV